jgi:capsular exopolysaccharide synthesis family protein
MDKNIQGINGNLTAAVRRSSLAADATPEALSRLAGTPLLTVVATRLVALTDQSSLGAEKFRTLAARLRYLQNKNDLKRLVITSAVAGEGKSLISANLAITLGRRQRTLLIDGDLRRSGLKDLFGTQNMRGLTDWWQRTIPIGNYLTRVEGISLWHLSAGEAEGQPLEILQSQRMSDMLTEIAESFDWVIIDSPPLAPVADGHVWATHADGTLLVVRQGKTPKKLLQKTLESVENLRLVGVVMNTSEEAQRRHYSQYYVNMEQASVSRVEKQQVSKPENPSLPDWTGSRR